MTIMHSTKTLGRSAIWSVLNQSLGQILSLIVFLVLARFLTKADFGTMAVCLLIVEFFKQTLLESLGTLFYSKKTPTSEDYNAGFFIVILGGAVSALIIFLAAKPIATILKNHEVESVLNWVSVLLLTIGLSKMHEIWLVKNFQFKTLAIRSITSISIGGVIGIYMAMNGYGISSLIVQQIVTAGMSTIWLWLATSWRPNWEFNRLNVLEIIRFGKYFSINSIASFFSGQSDVLLSSYYLGATSTGVYNASKRLLTAISLMVGSGLNNVALPALTNVSNHKSSFGNAYLKCLGLTTLITAPLYAGISILAPDIITVLMGKKWIESAPILSILAITGFLTSVNQYSWNILLIERKVRLHSTLIFVEAISNLIILIAFARYGIIPLALVYAGKSILLTPIISKCALKLLDLNFNSLFKKILMPILFSLAMAAAMYFLKNILKYSELINILVLSPLGLAVYMLLLWLFNRRTLMEAVALIKATLSR